MSAVSTTGTRFAWVRENARMSAFYAVTVAYLAFLLFALNEPMRSAVFAWTPGYGLFTHRVHHVMQGSYLTLLALGVAVQLHSPAQRVGGYLLTAVAVGSFLLVGLVVNGLSALAETATFVVPVVIVGLLHPGLWSFRPSRETLDYRMLVLAVLAAVPLAAFAALQVDLHLTTTDDHVVLEHYLAMAAGTVTIALGAIVASFRPAGWRVLAYGVALLATLVGIASALFVDPSQGTNFGLIGGVLAVVWTYAFLVAAEYGAWEASNPDAAGTSSDRT